MDSPVSSQASTGYLQDAIAGWKDGCKLRRIHDPSAITVAAGELQDLLHELWDSSWHGDPFESLSCVFEDDSIAISDEDPLSSCMPMSCDNNTLVESDPQAQHDQALSSSPSTSQGKDNSTHETTWDAERSHACSAMKALPLKFERRRKKKKKKGTRVVYPFAMVKPGGAEGDVTLADINERILMRPTRPVRHPVGEFAYGPCVSPDGPGLSGKAVVGLTKIHTQGKGTITIIRTRG